METIQEIIDTIKQWPSTIWWVMGALFYYLLVLGYATEKETK